MVPIAFVYFSTYCVLGECPCRGAHCPAGLVGGAVSPLGGLSGIAEPQALLAESRLIRSEQAFLP